MQVHVFVLVCLECIYCFKQKMFYYLVNLISGSRFALMEMKAILYNLLLNFSFEPTEKTEIPLKLKRSAFILAALNGVHLELRPRNRSN